MQLGPSRVQLPNSRHHSTKSVPAHTPPPQKISLPMLGSMQGLQSQGLQQQNQQQQQQQQQHQQQQHQHQYHQEQEQQPELQRPPSSSSSSTHVQRPARDSFLSQDSTATSAYPPSTITSAFSGPDTPPSPLSPSSQIPAVAEHMLYTPSIRPDDISSRLRLLAVNSYFLVCLPRPLVPHGPHCDASILTCPTPFLISLPHMRSPLSKNSRLHHSRTRPHRPSRRCSEISSSLSRPHLRLHQHLSVNRTTYYPLSHMEPPTHPLLVVLA